MATAADIANVPAGNIAATDVQGALNELDAEKASLTGATFSGGVNVSTNSNSIVTGASVRNSNAGSSAQVGLWFWNDSGNSQNNGYHFFICGSAFASPYTNACGVWHAENGPMCFATNNTERVRITATGDFQVGTSSTAYVTLGSTGITIADGKNVAVASTTGTKFGTATTQKLAFWNATPIVQPANTTDLKDALVNVGLLASGGVTPLDLDGGTLTAGAIVAPLIQNAQTGTAYTPVLTDAGKLVELSNAAAITLTVPPNSSVAYPTGTQINLLQTGAGQVTVAPGSGVTVNGAPGLKLTGQWSAATLIKRATNTWVLAGDLSS